MAGLAVGGIMLRGGLDAVLGKPEQLASSYTGEWRIAEIKMAGDSQFQPPNALVADAIRLTLSAPSAPGEPGAGVVFAHGDEPAPVTWTCDRKSVTLATAADPEKRLVLPCQDGRLLWSEPGIDLYLTRAEAAGPPLPEGQSSGAQGK